MGLQRVDEAFSRKNRKSFKVSRVQIYQEVIQGRFSSIILTYRHNVLNTRRWKCIIRDFLQMYGSQRNTQDSI